MAFGFGALPGVPQGLTSDDIKRLLAQQQMQQGAVPAPAAAPPQAMAGSPMPPTRPPGMGYDPLVAEDEAATQAAEMHTGMVPQAAPARAPRPLSFGAPVQTPAGPASSPQFLADDAPMPSVRAPLPPPRPLSFGPLPTPQSDMPAPGAAPAAFQGAPGAVPPAPAAAAAASPGFSLSSVLGALGNPRVQNLLAGYGAGLSSTPGFGAGMAAGTKLTAQLNTQTAAQDLAQSEYALKANKLRQETAGNNETLKFLVRKGYAPEDARSLIAASVAGRSEALTAALNNVVPKAEAGFRIDPATGVQTYAPGGPSDPATIRAKSQATAEGTTAGSGDNYHTRELPDGSVIAMNKSDPTDVKIVVKSQPARPVTPEERAAYGISPNSPAKMTAKGPEGVGGGNTFIDLGKKANQGYDDLANTKISESYDKSQGAIGTLKAISRQKEAIDGGIISGWGADYQTKARSMLAKVLGLDPALVVNSETFDAAASQKGAELAKAISQSGHTTNMDLQLGKTIAGGDRSKIEASIRAAVEAQEQLARDTIEHHNSFLDRVGKTVPETAERLGMFRVDTPETYQYRPSPAAMPDRSAIEAEMRRRGLR